MINTDLTQHTFECTMVRSDAAKVRLGPTAHGDEPFGVQVSVDAHVGTLGRNLELNAHLKPDAAEEMAQALMLYASRARTMNEEDQR